MSNHKGTLIGLISDTHDLLRPEARFALTGVDHIIHAGDICSPRVLQELGAIAPVLAVRGNNDRGGWAEELSEVARLEIDGVRIVVLHDLKDLSHELAADADVVITGHSHKPAMRMDGGVLYINPGSAGPRRFRLPVSVGFLKIVDGERKARLQMLEID